MILELFWRNQRPRKRPENGLSFRWWTCSRGLETQTASTMKEEWLRKDTKGMTWDIASCKTIEKPDMFSGSCLSLLSTCEWKITEHREGASSVGVTACSKRAVVQVFAVRDPHEPGDGDAPGPLPLKSAWTGVGFVKVSRLLISFICTTFLKPWVGHMPSICRVLLALGCFSWHGLWIGRSGCGQHDTRRTWACSGCEALQIMRSGWYFGLARDLCTSGCAQPLWANPRTCGLESFYHKCLVCWPLDRAGYGLQQSSLVMSTNRWSSCTLFVFSIINSLYNINYYTQW